MGFLHAFNRRYRRAMNRIRRRFSEPPLDLSHEEAERARFCFLGEFGYELISWLPYLLYLKRERKLRLRTVGRPGSSVFYTFSDEHVEVEASLIGTVWGDPAAYAQLRRRWPGELLVHPGRDLINRRIIRVDGAEWTTRNIHAPIRLTHYALLDGSHIAPWSPLPGRPIVVINNKYFVQWPDVYSHPVNYFDRESLTALRDFLTGRGYGVVYNHFVERTAVDEHLALDDQGIFGEAADTYDLSDDYRRAATPANRNRLQWSVYRAASLVIGPQGGNMYLPAISRKPLVILMRAGEYIDYTELGRIYGVPVEVFYEPRHMLAWLEAKLPAAKRDVRQSELILPEPSGASRRARATLAGS